MVREVSAEVIVPDTTVEEFNAIVLDTKSTILEYHKREGDPQASVTPWQDDERVITFAVPLTGVPEVIKTAIGTSTLTIRETQRRTWGADGSLTVTSEPLLDFMGGSRFTTSAAFVVRPHEAGGCVVEARVVCTAAGPWGLVSTIEGLMAEQAGESVRDFLHFCAAKCMTAGEPDLAPAGGFASDDLDSVYEAYQDASEALLPEVAVAGPAAQLSGLNAAQLQQLLQQLQAQSRGIETTLSSLRTAVVQLSPAAGKRSAGGSYSAMYAWLPLLLAFSLGACCGIMSARTSAALLKR